MHVRIAIIGAGFGGLGAAIRLKQRGHDDFVVFERAGDLGGTWRDNSYPGCACDVPSHVYSFSFALNPKWSSTYSPQPEIWDYLRGCADRFALRPSIRFNTDVRLACWDGDAGHWRIETSQSGSQSGSQRGSQGEWTADVLISAGGPLNEPVIPKLPGLETFRGETFHSSRWNHGHDLAGRRVAVIGTGASAVQFVPAIQPSVARLTLFQRTAAWVMPRNERPLRRWEHTAFQRIPGAQRMMRTLVYWAIESTVIGFLRPRVMRLAQRVALRNLRTAVADPVLRERLTPDYAMGCKRVLKSNNYYPALAAGQRRRGHRADRGGPSDRGSSPATASSTRSTPSSSAPGSASPTCRSPNGSAAATGAASPRCGRAARRRTAAPPSPASPTCSSCSARTPASATTPSS